VDYWKRWLSALHRSADDGGAGLALVCEVVDGFDLMRLRTEVAGTPLQNMLSAKVGDKLAVGGGYTWEVMDARLLREAVDVTTAADLLEATYPQMVRDAVEFAALPDEPDGRLTDEVQRFLCQSRERWAKRLGESLDAALAGGVSSPSGVHFATQPPDVNVEDLGAAIAEGLLGWVEKEAV